MMARFILFSRATNLSEDTIDISSEIDVLPNQTKIYGANRRPYGAKSSQTAKGPYIWPYVAIETYMWAYVKT